jgi:hypothetical protein
MELQSGTGRIILSYSAKAVNIVAGGSGGKLHIMDDNSQLDSSSRGTDVSEDNTVSINGQRLYNIVMHKEYGNHQIAIDVVGKGFQIYTFTFG